MASSPADTITVNGSVQGTQALVFDGATPDANRTSLAIADPTAHRTITLTDADGTVLLQDGAGNVGVGQAAAVNRLEVEGDASKISPVRSPKLVRVM